MSQIDLECSKCSTWSGGEVNMTVMIESLIGILLFTILIVAGNYVSMLRGLVKKYNKTHKDQLPNITPHSFRHTYCTNMANKGMNPNTLQYIMGHSNITMTLGYYAHGTFNSAKAELERLALAS